MTSTQTQITTATNAAPSRFNLRLSQGEYADSVKSVGVNRYHVASSSKPCSVREVIVRADGTTSCSCPARRKCIHVKTIEAYLASIVVIIAPCRCCGCRAENPNPYGCVNRARANDFQAVTG